MLLLYLGKGIRRMARLQSPVLLVHLVPQELQALQDHKAHLVPEVPQADKVPPGTGVPQVVEDPEGLKVSLVRPVLTEEMEQMEKLVYKAPQAPLVQLASRVPPVL